MVKMSWMAAALVLLGSIAVTADDQQKVVTPGEYWLGVQCFPVPSTIRAQLNVPEKQGLLIVDIAAESPASKAGLLRHDILLRAGDTPLMGPGDLIQAIEAVKENNLAIELIRDGKVKTVEATPEKRPEKLGRNAVVVPGPDDWEKMEKWLEGAWPGGKADGRRSSLRFRVIHPGAIVPRDVPTSTPLPPNVRIIISKEGDQPARITVKRSDEKWETTETDLDKLPADIRPHVERMLGRGPLGIVGDLPTFSFVPESGTISPPTGSIAWESRFERRLDEMNQRMDRLLHAMERSMGGHMHHKAPEKPTEK